jgi:hypothetical protein
MSITRDIITALLFVGCICLAGVYAGGAFGQVVKSIVDFISR